MKNVDFIIKQEPWTGYDSFVHGVPGDPRGFDATVIPQTCTSNAATCTGTNDGVATCTGTVAPSGSPCSALAAFVSSGTAGDCVAVGCTFSAGAACALNAGNSACAVPGDFSRTGGGDCVFSAVVVASPVLATCAGAATEVAATCTGQSGTWVTAGKTCDLDAATDGQETCPAGCSSTLAFTPTCDLDVATDASDICPAGCVYTATYVPACDFDAATDETDLCPIGCRITPEYRADNCSQVRF